jgi:hypothetical protein
MAKSKQPSAKMGDTIDGDAVEKPADQTAPPHASASNHSQTAPPPSGPPSSNAGSLITFAALALSIFADWSCQFCRLAATPEHSRYRRPYAG